MMRTARSQALLTNSMHRLSRLLVATLLGDRPVTTNNEQPDNLTTLAEPPCRSSSATCRLRHAVRLPS